MIALGDGGQLVATSTGGPRTSLHAFASADGGASWRRFASPVASGGAAYSSLVELAGGAPPSEAGARLGLLYEVKEPPPDDAPPRAREVTVLRFSTFRAPPREPGGAAAAHDEL